MYAYSGFCRSCRRIHTLHAGNAKFAAFDLMKKLDVEKRLDFHVSTEKADARFVTDYLFGQARGKMFGVLTCRQKNGSMITLKAFSGQYNGEWQLKGWAPPLFDLKKWYMVNNDAEKEIKKIGVQIESLGKNNLQSIQWVKKRKKCSRILMKKLHQLYRLHNFRSECYSLIDVYTGRNGIPNGTADCCGPKLLNWAARKNLQPLGLAEFYYGRQNRRGNRRHGHFYPSCSDKCGPILGFMLCGLNQDFGEEKLERSYCLSRFGFYHCR